MSWFGKSLVVLNTMVSLILLGAVTWMVVEQRQFAEDLKKRQEQIAQQYGRWDHVRGILASLLKEQQEGSRPIVWTVRVEDKRVVPQETISVAEAKRRLQMLEHGGANMPSLADLAARLKQVFEESARERDNLDKAQRETRALSEQLAQVAARASELQPAPGKPNPVEEMHQKQRDLELQIRDLELPLNLATQQTQVLSFRRTQLARRLQELQLLEQLPTSQPGPRD